MINNAEWFVSKLQMTGDTGTALKNFSQSIFGGFKIGIELLILNGLFTFIGLWMISHKQGTQQAMSN